MSSKSAAQTPVSNHSLFSKTTVLFIAFAIAVIYFISVVVYPLLFNSEREPSSTILDQPVVPPPMK